MPVTIPETLPARQVLQAENIFVMGSQRARRQDIRPLELAILNLMPTKITTETQLLRLLGNTALQVNITLVTMESHESINTPQEHLLEHYVTFSEIKERKFDGLIITGAPVEQMPFEEVDYWKELVSVFDWSERNVFSSFHICWASQAALYHRHGVPKYPIPKKMFGVFQHRVLAKNERLLRGFDDLFFAPHSRHTEIRRENILKVKELELLCESDEAGVYIVASRNRRHFYITGHSEYDPLTLKAEYDRDIDRGLEIEIPRNYYPDNDPAKAPEVYWRSHANLLFANWLNYYVYQVTPFNVGSIPLGGTYGEF